MVDFFGGQTNYTYDNAGRLISLTNPFGEATTYNYDGDGNMLTKTESGQTTTYVYNYEDKMVGVNLPGGTSIVYSYDHEGKRIGKTAGGATVDYYFDGDYVIMKIEGASVMVYYTQVQGLMSRRRGSSFYFYHYDGLGSTKALTDANQNSQASYIYDAWGNILQTNGTIINPYLYVGELGYYADGNAGMYLLTQRWYNPVIGRFVVRDPRGVRDLYNYTGANPLNNIDPTGLTIMPIDLREVCIPIWRHEEKVRRMEIGQARFCWRVTNSTGIGIPIAGPGVGGAVIPLVGYCSYRCDSPCLHEDVPIPFKVTITYLCISKCRGVYTKKETQTVYKVAHAAPVAWHCYQFGQEKKVTLPGYLVWDDVTNQWKCDLPPRCDIPRFPPREVKLIDEEIAEKGQ